MTDRRRKRIARIFAPRPKTADIRYGLHVLDNTLDEIRPGPTADPTREHQYSRWDGFKGQPTQRDAAPDDPWLSPFRSALIRECLIRIEDAAGHTPVIGLHDENDDLQLPPIDLSDLRGMCEDAELSSGHTDVLVLVGEGWSQREIAEWLGISQTTVWRYWHDGRRKLTGWLPRDWKLELADAYT